MIFSFLLLSIYNNFTATDRAPTTTAKSLPEHGISKTDVDPVVVHADDLQLLKVFKQTAVPGPEVYSVFQSLYGACSS